MLKRDEDRIFKEDLSNVKNLIYQNIYNNLTHIYKSKGTEKSIRNLIRCFGVDDDLVRLNVYGNNTIQRLDETNYRETVHKKTYADFHTSGCNGLSIFL